MNREQFIRELERLLKDLPAGEREAAIQYYNDYFDDAGAENEAQVIRELGSPAQVAGTIRDGMSENGEYTERGYENTRFSDPQEVSAGNRTAPAEAPIPAEALIRGSFWPFCFCASFCFPLSCRSLSRFLSSQVPSCWASQA